MSVSRLLAIAIIFVLATIAWIALGTSIVARTGEFDSRLRQEVTRLWGGEHVQVAPAVWVERPRQVTERVKEAEADRAPAREVTRTVVDRARMTPRRAGSTWTCSWRTARRGCLVLFSYAFFFEGFTGLTVTIGAIVTLFVLMQATARVDWEQVLGSGSRREPAAGARP